jgi:hypothetical protein
MGLCSLFIVNSWTRLVPDVFNPMKERLPGAYGFFFPQVQYVGPGTREGTCVLILVEP